MRNTQIVSTEIESPNLEPFFITLIPYFTYISVSSNEPLWYSRLFWADVYEQPELIKDWNELSSDDFKFYNLNPFESDPDQALDTLFWYKYPTLSSFFLLQRIDIPLCFRKSKSLYHSTMVTPQVRLLTMLMRKGRRSYVLKHYSKAISQLIITSYRLDEINEKKGWWRQYYRLFAQLKLINSDQAPDKVSFFAKTRDSIMLDHYQQRYTSKHYEAQGHLRSQSWLYKEWFKYLPVFNFYVRKVDKLKRKHSRGKSGKYSIVWKYVPVYKRFITVLRWFIKDVRFQKARTFYLRLFKTLELLMFEPSSTLVSKFRNFVHSYVFQNHKKTLLKHLRSVS